MMYSKGPFINLNVQGTHAYPNNLVHQHILKKEFSFCPLQSVCKHSSFASEIEFCIP